MSRPTLLFVLLVLALVLSSACTRDDGAGRASAPAGPGVATVREVVDGDTIAVEVAGRTEHVRLVGIDTPESVDPQRPVECHGPEASQLLHELLPPGTEVRLERDAEARDRYGRLLAYVFRRSDDLFVNEAVAAAGEAEVLEIPPNTAYGARIGAAVAAARAGDVGLWGACPSE